MHALPLPALSLSVTLHSFPAQNPAISSPGSSNEPPVPPPARFTRSGSEPAQTHYSSILHTCYEAHADASACLPCLQVASLVLTRGKAGPLASSHQDEGVQGGMVVRPGGFGGRPPGDVRVLVRQQLMALLERLGPQVMDPEGQKEQQGQGQGQEGGAQGQQPQQGAAASQEVVPLQLRLCGMELNRALRGEVVGEEGTAGDSSGGSSISSKHAFWASGPLGAGPSWEQVVSTGGCPAAGSPYSSSYVAWPHWRPYIGCPRCCWIPTLLALPARLSGSRLSAPCLCR